MKTMATFMRDILLDDLDDTISAQWLCDACKLVIFCSFKLAVESEVVYILIFMPVGACKIEGGRSLCQKGLKIQGFSIQEYSQK